MILRKRLSNGNNSEMSGMVAMMMMQIMSMQRSLRIDSFSQRMCGVKAQRH